MREPRLKKSSKEEHKAEVKLAEVEAQKKRLKNLIVLGKERGYLTYAEINDHLPDDMTDAEQIEGVVTMLADMGIAVYDEAPDAEQLLMTEAPAPIAEEDVIEEAEEALSTTIDAEFGRTTDPVRMYMREMGSVELLTREGEIEIAKRIEDGLKHMIHAISSCPTTIEEILRLADLVEKRRDAHRRAGRRPGGRGGRGRRPRRGRADRGRGARGARRGRAGSRGRSGRQRRPRGAQEQFASCTSTRSAACSSG